MRVPEQLDSPSDAAQTGKAMGQQSASSSQQRVIILMVDGLGTDYYAETAMPVLKRWAADGIYAPVQAGMPAGTNANNVGICCGAWPESHRTGGNSWVVGTAGRREYMGSSALGRGTLILEPAAMGWITRRMAWISRRGCAGGGGGAAWRCRRSATSICVITRAMAAPPGCISTRWRTSARSRRRFARSMASSRS